MTGEKKTRRRRVVTGVVVGAVVLALAVPAVRPLFPLLPAYEQTSCTVTSSSERHGTYRNRDVFPSVGTDCGTFAAEDEVTCTADPSRTVLLGPGTTYDLMVAGPRIPLLSEPTVLSAQVAQVSQGAGVSKADAGSWLDDFDDLDARGDQPASENLSSLQEQFSPESLRAFDYEQPPFAPRCDPYRMLMTSEGVQMVTPARAELLLRVPAGETARDPKLPCDDWYHCTQR